MKQKLFYLPLMVTLGMALSMPMQAKDLTQYSSSVVEFQVKLAQNGNTIAQYKLGTMYETGQGVEKNDKLAMEWYKKAADKGHQAAKNRLTFMEVKQSGYKILSHKEWLDSVKNEADSFDAAAMILLADMHILGLGVPKSPEKALALLKRTSAMGHSEVDGKIEAIERTINKPTNPVPTKAVVNTSKTAAAKKREEDEKRRKAAEAAKQDRLLAERRRLEQQRRELEAEKRRIEEQKRKLAAQSKQAEESTAAKEKDDDARGSASSGCTGPAARFRTTCK